MIILIGGEKGGSGKSTTATNLAVYLMLEGHDVMLLDCDKQGTATKWATRRNEAGYKEVHSAQKLGDVYKTAIDLSQRYGHVIIDAGGRDSRELRTGMVAADLIYIPLKASQADLETLPVVDELITLSRAMNPNVKARTLLCMAPTNDRIKEVEDARALLANFPDLPLSECIIRERKIYRDALLLGRGVVEMKNSEARAEIQLFGQEVLQ
ncbi:MAG TPA: division plane positioning ATPase MipZ [Rhodoferax sp.]|nr:division plane positioning ATPase MipZ [Rhodoferax sp.]